MAIPSTSTTSSGRAYAHLRGALQFLIEHGYFSKEELRQAVECMGVLNADELPDNLRAAGEAFTNFRRAAD